MTAHHVNILHKNHQGLTGLEILERRAKDKNPYDNISSVKLFYQYAVVNMPNFDKLEENYPNMMWENHERLASSLRTNRENTVVQKRLSPRRKTKSRKRCYSQRERKVKK